MYTLYYTYIIQSSNMQAIPVSGAHLSPCDNGSQRTPKWKTCLVCITNYIMRPASFWDFGAL